MQSSSQHLAEPSQLHDSWVLGFRVVLCHQVLVCPADPLLVNPALFSDAPLAAQPWAASPATRGCHLLQQYLDMVDKYPTPPRMVRAHVHKLLGDWLQVGGSIWTQDLCC